MLLEAIELDKIFCGETCAPVIGCSFWGNSTHLTLMTHFLHKKTEAHEVYCMKNGMVKTRSFCLHQVYISYRSRLWAFTILNWIVLIVGNLKIISVAKCQVFDLDTTSLELRIGMCLIDRVYETSKNRLNIVDFIQL